MILIVSEQTDPHAMLISAGLQQLKQPHQFWNPSASPLKQAVTVSIDGELEVSGEIDGRCWLGSQLRTVWYRREGQVTPPPELPADSHDVFKREAMDARRCAFAALETFDATWVNPWTNARTANNKLLQLIYAKRLGLKIPQTLVSNSPERIRAFHQSCEGKLVHKMFYPAVFEDERIASTSIVPVEALDQPASLAICSAIYQNQINKEFDVRVFIMGSTLFCVKLENRGDNEIDIRFSRTRKASRMDLPMQVSQTCLRLVEALGLLTGSIDLAYTKQGDWIFFEVNEGGQFIWLETLVPELPVLDAFCQFLSAPSAHFIYTPSSTRIDANELLAAKFANGSQIPSSNSTSQ